MKDKEERKVELLGTLFKLGGNRNQKALAELWEDFDAFFMNYNCYDVQVSDALTLLTIELERFRVYDYDRSMQLASPVCRRLLYGGLNDFYDVRLATAFILYTVGFEDAKDLADRALKKLEEYSDKEQYERVKMAISINVTMRLVMQMYSEDAIYLVDCSQGYNPELLFRQHFEAAMEYCEKNDELSLKALLLLRWGCYFKKKEAIKENLEWLKENSTSGYHEKTRIELENIGLDPDNIKFKEV